MAEPRTKANDDRFIEAEGRVGHDGHWGEGPARFPMEKCIESPPNQGEQNKAVNDRPRDEESVQGNRKGSERVWDEICEITDSSRSQRSFDAQRCALMDCSELDRALESGSSEWIGDVFQSCAIRSCNEVESM